LKKKINKNKETYNISEVEEDDKGIPTLPHEPVFGCGPNHVLNCKYSFK
jgi:hypothetical protein